jgi:hypothetical protein
MAYLEVSPMIAALRERPEDFEINRGWLTHFPSRHSYRIDSEGNVRLHAHCDCAFLSIRYDDGWRFGKPTRNGGKTIGGLLKSTANSPLILADRTLRPLRIEILDDFSWTYRRCGQLSALTCLAKAMAGK